MSIKDDETILSCDHFNVTRKPNSLVQMKTMISMATPIITKFGIDQPVPIQCYETKSTLSKHSLTDFTRNTCRPMLI